MVDKAVDSTVLDGYFEDIADAIRAKNGASDTYTPAQMPQAIADMPSGNPTLMGLLAGENVSGSSIVTVNGLERLDKGAIALWHASSSETPITELRLPDAISLGYNEGGGLRDTGTADLQVLDIPLCERIYLHNTNLVLTRAVFGKLKTINAPRLKTVSGYIRDAKLTSFDFPLLESVCKVHYCSALARIHLPSLKTSLINQNFAFNSALSYADIGNGSLTATNMSIATEAFRMTALDTLILRYSSLFALSNVSALNSTPIANGTGYIYVPRDLISTYQAATNWATYAAQFRALEDYTDDGTVNGEFIMPT